MLYALHDAAYRSAAPLNAAALMMRDFWRSPLNPAGETGLGRNIYASADLLANLTSRYGKPAWRIDAVTVNGESVPVTARPSGRRRGSSFAGSVATRRRSWPRAGGRRRRRSCWWPRSPATTPLCCAGRCRPSCRLRRLRHRLVQRPRRADHRRPVRLPRLCRRRHRYAGRHRPARPRGRGLPAGAAGAGRRGADGRGRRSHAAGQPHLDGLADRRPPGAHRHQPAGRGEAVRLVPVEHDLHRAAALPGRAAPRLSRASSSSTASCR